MACALAILTSAGSNEALGQSQQFYSLTPCRVVDTRPGAAIPAATERQFQIKALCGVPGDAKTVTLNVTAVTPSQDGFVTLWPAGGVYTGISIINVIAGQAPVANGAVMKLGTGTLDLSAAYGTQGGGTIHLVIDVTGYFK